MKDVKHPVASIGVGEKGYVTLVLTAQKEGGHSSIPGKTSSIDLLSKAIYKLREKEMPAKIIPPIKAYLTRTSAYTENFWKKISLSNLWLFEKWVLNDMSEAPASNALIRTTIVPTVFNSGVRDNVIPTFATAYVNSRILPGETQQDVFNFVTKAINDTQIKVTYYPNYSTLPSSTTDINSSAFKKLEKAINGTIEDVVVAPVIMVGATDSRSYRDLSDGVVNFSPLTNAKGYHGIDERLLITDLQKGIHYYTLLIKGEK
jgi:carboxypeptidase PM20D1